MIQHYLKVAFRNLWKYKSQTLISVVGMAVGFTCFAMATLWIRYEMTYDSFHKNAGRLYNVSIKDPLGTTPDGLTSRIEVPLNLHLKKTFPEVNNATRIMSWRNVDVQTGDDAKSHTDIIWTDSSFLKMFDIKILAGNGDFMIYDNKQIALTQEKVTQLFGNENPLGKTIKLNKQEYTIGAIVSGYSNHSNYPFEMLGACHPLVMEFFGNVLVELVPDVDVKSFNDKLYDYKTIVGYQLFFNDGEIGDYTREVERIVLSPLTSIHYNDIRISREVKFQHVIIFAIAGMLLIICTLFNYLALFVSRFRLRMRELALRIVCGATNRSLFTLLSVEFLMSLVVSFSLGVFLIYLIIPHFRTLSGVDIELSFIYVESLMYIATIILVSLLTFLIVLYIFRRRTLNVTVRKSNNKMFRKVSIVSQLIISIVFAFCTVIILKQMYYLRNTDLGFTVKDRGCVNVSYKHQEYLNTLENQLQQIPEIEETAIGASLFDFYGASPETYDWNERPQDVEPIKMKHILFKEKVGKLYEFKLVAGEMLNENDSKDCIMINESAAKIFGWKDPAGKQLVGVNRYFPDNPDYRNYIVKGVIKDIHCSSFTGPADPIIFRHKSLPPAESVLFRYREGTWNTCKDKIEQLFKEKYPDINGLSVRKEEFNYAKYLKSENTLLTILTLISLVCLTVCVFGFVSMVSLTCEERRKEIAIRKINGATIKDILDIFFKEYLTLFIVGALIAFPAGYVIMKRWIEGYALQTEMSAWIYISILVILTLTIVLCVGGKVYKTSCENPVEAINS